MAPRKQTVLLLLVMLGLTGCRALVVDLKQRVGLMPTPRDSERMMRSRNPDEVREGILGIIDRQDSDPYLVGLFVERLTQLLAAHDSQLVRSAAAIALGNLGEKTLSVPALLTALEDEGNRPVVLADVAAALAKLGAEDVRVRPAMIKLFDASPDATVRRAAVVTLGIVGGEDDLLLLLKALEDDNSLVKYGAAESLRALTGMPFGADTDLWQEWYDTNKKEELLTKWQAEQDRIEAEQGAAKGGFFDNTGESVDRVGSAIFDEIGLGLHELLLAYKRAKRDLLDPPGRTPPDREALPQIDLEAPAPSDRPEEQGPKPSEPVITTPEDGSQPPTWETEPGVEPPEFEPPPESGVEGEEEIEEEPEIWEYPIVGIAKGAEGVYDGAAWLGDKVVTYPIEAVKWIGDQAIFWDEE